MFTNKRLVTSLSCGALLVGLTGISANAVTLSWDHNTNGTQSDGGGSWLGANQWLNGLIPSTWADNDDAVFGAGGAGGTLDLSGGAGVIANDVTFNNFTGSYTIANDVLTVNGTMTLGPTSGNVVFSNAAGTGFAGTGNIIINGIYPTSKAGATQLRFSSLSESQNNFTGTYTVNNGILFTQGGSRTGGDQTVDENATIILNGNAGAGNGAVFSSRWGGLMNRDLGTGAGQIQVLGRSGFEGQGTNALTVRLNNSATTPVVWGSANFNPDVLILQSMNANTNAPVNFDTTLDLNGADRTISVDLELPFRWDSTGNNEHHTGRARMIRSMQGTGGLIKVGVGQLSLEAENTYTGNTTVNEGILTYATEVGMATTGTTTFNDGTQLRVEIGNGNEFEDTGTGAGTINGLLNGVGRGGATVNYNGNVDLVIVLTQNGQDLNLDLGDLGGGGTTTNVAIIERDFTLSGNNTFSGTLKVSKRGGSARTMTLGSSTALQNANVILDTSGSTTLDLAGFDATIANLILGSNNGGSRGNVDDTVGGGTLTLTNGITQLGHNGGNGGVFADTLNLNGTEQLFDVENGSAAHDLLITSVIENGSVRIQGNNSSATTRFEGTNTYTGTTTVASGTLSTNNAAAFADASTVVIESNGTLNLDFVGIDLISALTVNGDVKGVGIYDATTDPSFITGTGQLQVIPEPSTLALIGLGGLMIARRRRD